jgi:glycosyltransferase involved in cell wall biosynthesis
MTLLTERVIDRLREVGPIRFLNWSPGGPASQIRFALKRLFLTLACLARLLGHGRVHSANLYVVANSKSGLFLTGLAVSIGRRLGYRVYLHHHTYYYIDRRDWRMALIDRSLGPDSVHVVHCRQMADDFRATYATAHRFEYVLPSVFSLPISAPRQSIGVPIRIGHLGNLSIAKGLDLVLETFRKLLDSGRNAHLRLAGPFHTLEAERLVRSALAEFPQHINYVGPVYGQTKIDFLNSTDCFLFPSRSESWGIVLNEAMASGVPVIATRRGCIPTQIGKRAGLVVDDSAKFVRMAAERISVWMDSPDKFRAASQAAVEQADYLNREGQRTLNEFAKRIFAVVPESTGSP